MDDFLSDISDEDLLQAKKRLWNRVSSRMLDREVQPFENLVQAMPTLADQELPSRLQHAQAKEHLLDLLPEQYPTPRLWSLFSKKWMATSTLSVFLAILFVPLFGPSHVLAKPVNRLDVVQGSVRVNGQPVTSGVILQEGDRVSTLAGSMAHVRFADDTRVTLGPDTEIHVQEVEVDPRDLGNSLIVVNHQSGRIWTQVLNLVSSEAEFRVDFPKGDVSVRQRASFDLNLNDEEAELKVVRNLVRVNIDGETDYSATLGQGAAIQVGADFALRPLMEEDANETWWAFNEAYGKEYAQVVNDTYQSASGEQVNILPGNPFYGMKTLRENVQVALTFSGEGREALNVQHAQNRLNEAQVLIDRGNNEAAARALKDYEDKVDQVQGEGKETLLADLVETQKAILAKTESNEGDQLLEATVRESKLRLSNEEDKKEAIVQTASQQLARVPDAIAEGNLTLALLYLSNYKEQARSILTELELVPLEEREDLVVELLDQKLQDLHMLRVINSLPEMQGQLDADPAIIENINLLVLSLSQRSLDRLTEFFTNTNYDLSTQFRVYERFKGSAEVSSQVTERLESIEEELENFEDGEVLMEVQAREEAPVVDPRVRDLHEGSESKESDAIESDAASNQS